MRLDLFLMASRLAPRRTVAQRLCEAGRVRVNGHPAKSSHVVKTDDEILIVTPARLKRARVVSVPDNRQTSRKEAPELIEVLEDHALSTD
jgi:ribosomal 50S subunit-recycling heat shock protein